MKFGFYAQMICVEKDFGLEQILHEQPSRVTFEHGMLLRSAKNSGGV